MGLMMSSPYSIARVTLLVSLLAACASPSDNESTEPRENAAAEQALFGRDFEVAKEVCNKSYEIASPLGGSQKVFYAEHAYPGKTKFEIAARVRHWTEIKDPAMEMRPAGYELNAQLTLYTRDGFAGAGCQEGTTTYFTWR